MQSEATPFAQLGTKLKVARQSAQESVAEAAGAVEIGEEDLRNIERGVSRPSEEILMLLIQHFAMEEDEAIQLWKLAGYDKETNDDEPDNTTTKTIVMAISLDPRIVYSDQVQINGNKHGVVFNFMQPSSGALPTMPVSRVGMSREQAWSMLRLLHNTLILLDKQDEPKQLPPSVQGE